MPIRNPAAAIIGTRTCAVYQYNRTVVVIFGTLGTLVALLAVVSFCCVSVMFGRA